MEEGQLQVRIILEVKAILRGTKQYFIGYCSYYKNLYHQAKHCKACKDNASRNKNQQSKPFGLKEQGQIKTYNSFDPLAKYDPSFSLCNDYGHDEQNCPFQKEDLQKDEPTINKCGLALCAHSDENQWFVDSGCSRHVSGDRNKFTSLIKKDGNMSFGSGSAKITGK